TTCMGLFLVLFGLSSAVVKERLYLSESILTTTIGTIIGPCVLGLLVPQSWPELNTILLEVSRLIIILQIMAAIVCLPAKLHWKALLILLGPVMIGGWVITAALVHYILGLSWPISLAIGAALSPTDPILANSIVKGKFADKHVPRHVRNLISAESSANDATGALFVQFALLLILHPSKPAKIATDFVLWITLYQNVLGAVYGAFVGYLARHALKYAEKNDMIDMENFLAFSLTLSIFVDGSSVLLYFNDFVSVVFAAIAFGWDGAFYEQSKHSPFQEILDNLSNAWFFVFNGTLIPWTSILTPSSAALPQFWQHLLCSLAILAFRRIPITALCYPLMPSLTTVSEALFVGHFGPMAGGAVFYMAQMRGQLGPDLYPELEPTIQFVIVSSIVVHGVTVPLFKLG
ncbi:Cation/H+ exchanger, partial [Catenaria anguillulae PL171]